MTSTTTSTEIETIKPNKKKTNVKSRSANKTEEEIAQDQIDIDDIKDDELIGITDLDLLDVAGIGPTVARNMKHAGIVTVSDLAIMTAKELSEKIGKKNEDECYTYIHAARNLLTDSGLLTKDTKNAMELLDKEEKQLRLKTGSTALDGLLTGGLEAGSMTEFYGEFGSGKSQICHTAAVLATTPVEEGGLDGNVLWLDTEGTMRAHRLKQICIERGLDPVKVLSRIIQMKVYVSSQLELIVEDMASHVRTYKPKLIIIDSIIALHRAEFTGRGTLADRQQRLNGILNKMGRVADVKQIVVIITNQISSNPQAMFGNPNRPTGGNIIGHGATYRVGLRKTKGGRVATMIDSPLHPYSEVEFCLNEKGIDDIDKDKLKKKLAEVQALDSESESENQGEEEYQA